MTDWRSQLYLGWKSNSEFWVRWTCAQGLYWWLHPTENRWVGEPEQITMPSFPTRKAAYDAMKTAPVPPTVGAEVVDPLVTQQQHRHDQHP